MSLALATSTAPAAWWDEDDETLATALQLLDEQAARMKESTDGA